MEQRAILFMWNSNDSCLRDTLKTTQGRLNLSWLDTIAAGLHEAGSPAVKAQEAI